jgi:hypothetical protein
MTVALPEIYSVPSKRLRGSAPARFPAVPRYRGIRRRREFLEALAHSTGQPIKMCACVLPVVSEVLRTALWHMAYSIQGGIRYTMPARQPMQIFKRRFGRIDIPRCAGSHANYTGTELAELCSGPQHTCGYCTTSRWMACPSVRRGAAAAIDRPRRSRATCEPPRNGRTEGLSLVLKNLSEGADFGGSERSSNRSPPRRAAWPIRGTIILHSTIHPSVAARTQFQPHHPDSLQVCLFVGGRV